MPKKRADIDWLGVLAVLLLFVTHPAPVSGPLRDWQIASPDTSRILGQFTVVMAPWLMPLFMKDRRFKRPEAAMARVGGGQLGRGQGRWSGPDGSVEIDGWG